MMNRARPVVTTGTMQDQTILEEYIEEEGITTRTNSKEMWHL